MAWLWKDRTAVAPRPRKSRNSRAGFIPHYLARCGGTYSSKWFFSKILHCLRTSPAVFDAACLWVECADWIPAMLTGTESPDQLAVGICAAGHKAISLTTVGAAIRPTRTSWRNWIPNWASCVRACDQKPWPLIIGPAVPHRTLVETNGASGHDIPVATGAIDAHLAGAVGNRHSAGRCSSKSSAQARATSRCGRRAKIFLTFRDFAG